MTNDMKKTEIFNVVFALVITCKTSSKLPNAYLQISMICEGEVRSNRETGPNRSLFINLVQKCSLNRDISITHYCSWHKLKCGLFAYLVIRPEVPGNADNEGHTKRGHMPAYPVSGEDTGIQ